MFIQWLLLFLQIIFVLIFSVVSWRMLRSQQQSKQFLFRDSNKELDRQRKLRQIRLTKPLAEHTRPTTVSDVIGQENGIVALRAALCGPNPQHVIIYGPPGVGKTATARLLLEEARRSEQSPFRKDAPFIEVDATVIRFDERGIADPLLGSIHDPIYQGAGAMGVAGVPQPKPGAVTKAHGGILFLDEIGELHPHQMNKLLKVLEDGKVMLESAYYSRENRQIPPHIHDLFEHGLPADFRLVGATTRSPEEIPAALRSRCIEIFFRPLQEHHIRTIALQAIRRLSLPLNEQVVAAIARYARNGRDANHLAQLTCSVAQLEQQSQVTEKTVEWIASISKMVARPQNISSSAEVVGKVCGLAVSGQYHGLLLEMEAVSTTAARSGNGVHKMTGLIEEEQIGDRHRTVKRKSMAGSAWQNVLTALRLLGYRTDEYDIHLNVIGGVPADGPSAGVTMAVAIASSLSNLPVPGSIAMTGEISLHGMILTVGGIEEKLEAARAAGIRKVYIPAANLKTGMGQHERFEVVGVETLTELFSHLWGLQSASYKHIS